jgi:hypothetical protein
MNNRESIIKNYIEGYNQFDIDKMVENLDSTIVFENITNGVTTMSLRGIEAFKQQAERAKLYFSERTQIIKSLVCQKDESIVEIDYRATLATDLPNGLKKGEELRLQGRSIFLFSGNKIVALTDIS